MNFFGQISRYFIENKKFSFLIFIGIILWGVLSYIVTPKQYNPEITAPAFEISVNFPGATSSEVYELITRPLEDVVQEIPGVDEIFSQSHHGGQSIVIAQFDVGENFDLSKIRLNQRINTNLNLKPLGITDITIKSIDPDNLPIFTLGLLSDKLDPVTLRKKAFAIKNELKMINGVSIVKVWGGQKRDFQILIDPQKLAHSKTTIQEIETTLSKSSLLSVLGNVKGQQKFHMIETSGTVRSIDEIKNLVIASNIDRSLKIGDIATVKVGTIENDQHLNYINQQMSQNDTVMLTVAKKKGANISAITQALQQKILDLKQNTTLFQDITPQTLKDEGRVANEEISGLMINLIQAITIVFIVLLIFLNMRAAFMVAITIPLTLLTVFGIGYLAGHTINRITLFALILSLGLLVDSATVVVENIVRHKRENPHKDLTQLISEAVSEVGTGLLLSTLTTVLAFIPMKFVTGMMGPYMGPLPFFVATAIVVALVYSYTIVPWLAAIFCKESIHSKKQTHVLNKLSKYFAAQYIKSMTHLLSSTKKRRWLLGSAFLLFLLVLTIPLFEGLRFRMLPKADREQMYVYLDLDSGTSIDRTLQISKKLTDRLTQEKEIISIQSFVGMPPILDFNGLFKGATQRQGTHQATFKLNLTHPQSRSIKSENLALKYRQIIKAQLSSEPDARSQLIEDPPGPPVKSTFLLKVKGQNQNLVKKVILDLESKIKQISEVKDIDNSLTEEHIKYSLRVDTEKAAISKVSTAAIAKLLQVLYSGSVIGIYHDNNNLEQETITLKFERSLRDSITDLKDLTIVNELGIPIAVRTFLKIEEQNSEPIILSDNREQVVYLSAEMGARSITYATIDLLKILSNYQLPGTSLKTQAWNLWSAQLSDASQNSIKLEIAGEWLMTLEVFRDLGLAMLIAILLIYFVLVAQFKNFMIPLLILGTIPLAIIGVFPGFALLFATHQIYFSATSMIGVIALAGIVVNNAIILVEYILQRLKTGLDLKAAIIEACTIRMRPIILTSVTTILGSLTIAGDPVWSGLAWSIVFGLSLSTILTLIVFPTLLFHVFQKRLI